MGLSKTVYALWAEEGFYCIARGVCSGRGIKAQVQATAEHPDDVEFKTAVQSADMDVNAGGAVWAVTMPGVSSLLRWVPVPFASIKKSREVLPSLLDIQIPFPVEECVYGVLRWDDLEGSHRAHVFAAREENVLQHVARVKESTGVDPEWVVQEGVAMKALTALSPKEPVVDMHWIFSAFADRISLAAFHQGQLQHVFSIRHDAKDEDGQAAAVQQLAERIPNAGTVDRLFWTGPVSCSASTETFLQEKAGRKVDHGMIQNAKTWPVRMLAAVVLQQKNQDVNLRRGGVVHPRTEKQVKAGEQSSIRSLIAAAALMVFLSIGWFVYTSQAESNLRAGLLEQAKALAPESRIYPGQEVLTVQRALDDQKEQRDAALAFARDNTWSGMAKIAGSAAEAGVTLSELRLDVHGVSLEAVALDAGVAQAWLNSLSDEFGPLLPQQKIGGDGYTFRAEAVRQ